jgi:CheY-like chemotaxis protein
MNDVGRLLDGIGSILWPLLIVLAVILFHRQIRSFLDSLSARGLTLEIGGQKITIQEAHNQEQELLSDLSAKVSAIELRLSSASAGGAAPEGTRVPEPTAPTGGAPTAGAYQDRALLWVDDNPRNNAILVQNLSNLGVTVVPATSTKEALADLESRRFDAIVTDIGRGPFGRLAGIDLIERVKADGRSIPTYVYTGPDAVSRYQDMALKAGASGITASPTTLLSMLRPALGLEAPI